jgi:acyl-CoA thioesterase FadM
MEGTLGMESLRLLHKSIVGEEEIDELGHLNVRHYGQRALASTEKLLSDLGVIGRDVESESALGYDLPRLYTRYQREQLVGAPVEVHGGLLAIEATRIRLYHELVNPVRDEIAATFVHEVMLYEGGSNEPTRIAEPLRKELSEAVVAWPEYGRPRSIDLDASPIQLSLTEAVETGLALRRERRIAEEDCDAKGRVTAAMRPYLMWGGQPIGSEPEGPPILDLADGGRMGWASMETRSVMVEQPMVGTRIQSFAATVELGRKTNLRRYWVFDLDTGRLLLANEVVELALHLEKRCAIEIPAEIRTRLEATARFDLR